MSKEAHTTDQITPGLWELVADAPMAWVSAVNDPGDGGDIICNGPDTDCKASVARWPANAHLIAAAPELFAIINELHGEFDRQTYLEISRLDHDPLDGDEFSVNITAKQLRAINQAILKAEGKI